MILRLLFLSLLVFALVLMSGQSGAQTRQLRLCAPDYSVGMMPFFIAQHRGYYAEEGMKVEVIAGRGQLCTMALIAGSVNFTSSPSTFDSLVSGEIRGKVIYVLGQFLLHRFVVAPEIKKFADLKGKKLGISGFGTLTDQLTREILSQYGLKAMEDVFLLQTASPAVRYAALKAGNVQGALLSSQYALEAVKEGFRELDYDPPPYATPVITKDEMLKNDPAAVRSFIRASLKGHLFFGQRAEGTIELIRKVLRIEDREKAKQFYDEETRRYNPGGQFEERSMKRVIERARKVRHVEREVNARDVFDLSLAGDIDADLRRVKWNP